MKTIVSIYNPPEYYPPTLHAVELLAKKAERITIVTRNISCKSYKYPDNVEVVRVGRQLSLDETASQSQVKKMLAFLSFLRKLSGVIKREKPGVWLGYDSIGLYALYLVSRWGSALPKVFWYHSHDVREPGAPARKYSITWWAEKYEPIAFKKLQVFSLPASERLQYFPLSNWKGKYFVAPNYPLRSPYERLAARNGSPTDSLKLIYQGRISQDHGFEELIPLLNETVNGKRLELTLIGIISDAYKEQLTSLAEKYNTLSNLHILKPVPYDELPAVTAMHHVGLAIHKPATIIYSTGGTASNKIYEYAAVGLPVLLFDNSHYRQYLEDMQWTFFTDCSKTSILAALQGIADHYIQSSDAAFRDFTTTLNYEASLQPVLTEVFNRAAS